MIALARYCKWIQFLMVFLAFMFVTTTVYADSKSGIITLYYDAVTRKVCFFHEGMTKCDNTEKEFSPMSDFFRTGTVIVLLVGRGKLLSQFSVKVDKIEVAENISAIRGLAAEAASAPSTTAVTGKGATDIAAVPLKAESSSHYLESMQTDAGVEGLQKELSDQEENILKVYRYLQAEILSNGPTTRRVIGPVSSTPLVTMPGSTIADIQNFAKTIQASVTAQIGVQPFIDADMFDSLARNVDALVASVKLLNSSLKDKDFVAAASALQQDFTNARAQQTIFANNMAALRQALNSRSGQPRPDLTTIREHLNAGESILGQTKTAAPQGNGRSVETALGAKVGLPDALEADAKYYLPPPDGLAQINALLASCMDGMNQIYDHSEQREPVRLSLGTYDKNYQVWYQIYEKANFTRYGFRPADLGTEGTTDGKSSSPLGAVRVASPADTSSDTQKNASAGKGSGTAQPQNQSSSQETAGKLVYGGWFTVHQFYEANIISGFTASTLRNVSFSVRNNIAYQSENSRPQMHPMAGLNYYVFGSRDLFPGRLHRNDYLKPGLFIGTALDQLNNYYIGFNWEIPNGLDLSLGYNVGQEKQLANGVIAGQTVLPTGTTTAPTVDRFRNAFYVSIGFDMRVFRAVFGKGSVSTAGASGAGTGTSTAKTGSKAGSANQ